MSTLALDIGGANLKAADDRGLVRSHAFELWRHPERLAGRLERLIAEFSEIDSVAATMTAELCDCFETKREGVLRVLEALERIAEGRTLQVWQTDGRLVLLDEARQSPLQAAAANWRALAQFACRFCPLGAGLLVDVGSTTADLVPLAKGAPVPLGKTDTERLVAGELVYTGVRRTPVCAMVSQVPWRDKVCPVAAEWFATSYDVYLTLGELPENADDQGTADGRPATRKFARDRLARVICADREIFTDDDARTVARAVREAQETRLKQALQHLLDRLGTLPETVVISGEGEFLARRIASAVPGSPRVVSLRDQFSQAVSQAACAFALAVLAEERRSNPL